MPELLTPGVVVQEVPFGPQPIEGVSTSTAGFAGETAWGPESGKPLLVTSVADFERKFGGPDGTKVLPLAIRGFFDNGGRRAFISRVIANDADAATLEPDFDGVATRIRAVGSDGRLTLSSVVGARVDTGITLKPLAAGGSDIALAIDKVIPSINVVVASTPADLDGVTPLTHYAEIGGTSGTGDLQVSAAYPGAYGNRLSVSLEAELVDNAQVESAGPSNTYVLSRVDFLRPGDRVYITRDSGPALARVARVVAVQPGPRTVELEIPMPPPPDPMDPPLPPPDVTGSVISLIGWRLDVLLDGRPAESLSRLPARVDVDSGAAVELQTAVADRSQWVRVTAAGSDDPPVIDPLASPGPGGFPTFALGAPVLLTGGSEGTAVAALDVIGSDTARTGLKALEAQDGINLIAAPGFPQQSVVNELISQAERLMDRFAVFENEAEDDEPTDALTQRALYNSKYAAMYYPWVEVIDPVTRTHRALPPSGHVLGAYARTDNDRGVFKAPANVVLRNVLGFSRDVSNGEQDLLNPEGVDVLRRFDGLGNVIWGARTVSADTLWRYVPVRRLFIFLEQSIVRGTRYAVFEPNDLRLWARIRDSVTNFLTSQWRAGALFGRTPEEAFFVKVDETTTTQDDRDNGRVNIIVGIAPVKPAEFVVFQIGQAPNSVIVAEQS
jgi:hypothetical protein